MASGMKIKKIIENRKIRVSVIGAGVWAIHSHIPVMKRRANEIEFVGLCRPDLDEAQKVAEKFGFKMYSDDYKKVLEAGADLVVVSSPALFHYEHAKAALLSGAHVLIEKPITLNSRDCRDLIRISDETGLHVVCSFGWNYMSGFSKTTELMNSNAIGEICAIQLHMASGCKDLLTGDSISSTGLPEDRADPRTYANPKFAGGGYLQTQFSHALGWFFGVFDLKPIEVYARLQNEGLVGIETHASLSVKFENDAIGTMSASAFQMAAEQRQQLQFNVFGADGYIQIDLEHEWIKQWDRSGLVIVDLGPGSQSYNCDGPPNALLDLIQGRTQENKSPLTVGLRSVELIEATYESVRFDKSVLIPVTN